MSLRANRRYFNRLGNFRLDNPVSLICNFYFLYCLRYVLHLMSKLTIFFPFKKLESFHLNELSSSRHMLDYESLAGQTFMKDNRLKSYKWTDTGIQLMIANIDKEKDLGKYEADVATGHNKNVQKMMAIKEIWG